MTVDINSPEFGQLFPAERQLLHDAVIARKPELALEIGTWRGAGSTLAICRALEKNKRGHLHTCEIDQGHHNLAKEVYEKVCPWLSSYVTLHLSDSRSMLDFLFARNLVPELTFLDGSENPDETRDDTLRLEEKMAAGGV